MSAERTFQRATSSFPEGTAPTIKARLTKDDGTLAVQADFSALTYKIHKVTAAGVYVSTVETGTLTISTEISDTALYDDLWGTAAQTNSKGYNFRKRFSAANLTATTAITYYEFHIRGTLTDGTKCWAAPTRVQVSPFFMGSET